jgi:hypothetical protein
VPIRIRLLFLFHSCAEAEAVGMKLEWVGVGADWSRAVVPRRSGYSAEVERLNGEPARITQVGHALSMLMPPEPTLGTPVRRDGKVEEFTLEVWNFATVKEIKEAIGERKGLASMQLFLCGTSSGTT